MVYESMLQTMYFEYVLTIVSQKTFCSQARRLWAINSADLYRGVSDSPGIPGKEVLTFFSFKKSLKNECHNLYKTMSHNFH